MESESIKKFPLQLRLFRNQLLFTFGFLLVALLLFQLSRTIFFLYNQAHFAGVTSSDLTWYSISGLRFDLSAVFILNIPLLLCCTFLYDFLLKRWIRTTLWFLFIIPNASGLAANYIDCVYFHYIDKRTTWDIWNFLGNQVEMKVLIPLFLVDNFLTVLLFLVNVALLMGFFRKHYLWLSNAAIECSKQDLRSRLFSGFLFLLFIGGLSVIAIRGGLQKGPPLSIVDAGKYAPPAHTALVLNSPFTIIKSAELSQLSLKNWLPEEEAQKLFSPVKINIKDSLVPNLSGRNVVFIILESFSLEYTAEGNHSSCTPFFDSLKLKGLYCNNCFSNGKRSIEGIPAILASMPSFDFDYISTIYGNNRIESVANSLKKSGYHSSFFHGGNNGTMNFDSFTSIAGFDSYFGRNEYNDDQDYDGHWGIWDHKFILRFAQELGNAPRPFFSTVFTLSSHHPYRLPDGFERFEQATDKLPIEKVIRYTDYSLETFFTYAKSQPWYNNTLFVITADHTGISEDSYYSNSIGNYRIPLLYFAPGSNLSGVYPEITQQIDIMPTVFTLLRSPATWFSFGRSIFDKNTKPFAVYSSQGMYHYYSDSLLVQFQSELPYGIFSFYSDSLMKQNLVNTPFPGKAEIINQAKAFIQEYNRLVINNSTYIK